MTQQFKDQYNQNKTNKNDILQASSELARDPPEPSNASQTLPQPLLQQNSSRPHSKSFPHSSAHVPAAPSDTAVQLSGRIFHRTKHLSIYYRIMHMVQAFVWFVTFTNIHQGYFTDTAHSCGWLGTRVH